eukprot:3394048-Amphidinium_carterae.1
MFFGESCADFSHPDYQMAVSAMWKTHCKVANGRLVYRQATADKLPKVVCNERNHKSQFGK